MAVRIIGLSELGRAIGKMQELLDDPELITEELERLMTEAVHVDTGYLKSTLYHKNNIAGADAPYAGFEEERGQEHAYATIAIDRFNVEEYVDKLVEPF